MRFNKKSKRFNRRFLLLALLPLAACGFEPVYGTGTAATNMLGKIEIHVVKGRNGFELRDRLLERLGSAGVDAPYALSFKTTIKSDDLTISDDNDVTRFTLTGVTTFQITDKVAQAVVYDSTVTSNTAYSATSGTYPTSIAERDANVRLNRDLADKIITILSITAKDWLK
jgi:LPS-assembly lipoprotein